MGLDFGLWKNGVNGRIEYFEGGWKDLLLCKELVGC